MAGQTLNQLADQIPSAAASRCTSAKPIIFLPGTLCDERVFGPLIERLPGREVHVLPITGADTTRALATAILAKAPPLFVLVGFSLGGIVALEIALSAPHRVIGLGLIASNARADGVGAERRRADVADAKVHGMTDFVLDRLWSRYVGKTAQSDRVLQRVVLDMAETLGLSAFAQQSEVAIGRADRVSRLADLPMPVLAIGGEEDVICPPAFHQEIAAGVPNATFRSVPGAGHFVLLEAPEAVAGHLSAWLDRLCLRE